MGGSGLVVDMTIFYLLTSGSALGITVSKIAAAEVALLNNFFWNEIWTFRNCASDSSTLLRRVLAFHVICIGGVLLTLAALHIQIHLLHVNMYLANGISILLASVWNFLLNTKFSWNLRAKAAVLKRV